MNHSSCSCPVERGYTDADYYGSTSACVESALAILRANSRFREASTRTNWFFTLHCIEAVLVAFGELTSLFLRAGSRHPAKLMSTLRVTS